MIDTGDNMYDAAYEALDYYCKFYVAGKNDILLNMMTQTDDLEYASDLASQIQEQVYAQSAAKANLKNAKKAQSFMDIGMLALDTAVTSYSMIQYDDDTKNLFARTINQEMFEYADYYDISWNNVSDKITNTLRNSQSIVANTAVKNVAEFAVEKVTEEGAKKALSAFTSKSNVYAAAAQIGFFVASLINYKSNQAFSADMNAIWLSAIQYDVAMLVSSLVVKEGDEFHFSNVESLEKLKDMFTLYYRVTIAFSENFAKSLEEFGTKEGKERIEWFSSTTEHSVCNYTAEYLYRITNCTIVPIVPYSNIKDDVLTKEWLSENSTARYNNVLVSDAYFDCIKGYRDTYYCYHIPELSLLGNTNTPVSEMMYEELYEYMENGVYPQLEESVSVHWTKIAYIWGIRSNLVSIIVERYSGTANNSYFHVYNCSADTGDLVSTEEVLTLYGYDSNSFQQIARSVLENYWDEKHDMRDKVGVEWYDDRVEKTLSAQNLQECIPFIAPDGSLGFVARIYSLAGGDSYYHLMYTQQDSDLPEYINCTIDHSRDQTTVLPSNPLEFFIENCDRVYFTEKDVKGFDEEMCMYARNAIFAKSGRQFKSEDLKAFFAKYGWYNPVVAPEDFTDSMLNTIQKENLALVMAREAEIEQEAYLASLTGDKAIYTNYLHSKGYDEILGEYPRENVSVRSLLADLDNDGIQEVFLSIDTGNGGIKGKENFTVVLDQVDGEVIVQLVNYYGGGSMGGNHLVIKYDLEEKNHILAEEGYTYAGVDEGISALILLTGKDFTEEKRVTSTFYRISCEWYQEYIEQIKSETNHYEINEDRFYFYKIDGVYVSREEYENAIARYTDAQESHQLIEASYEMPIP